MTERLDDFVGDERKIKQILLNLLSNAVKIIEEFRQVGTADAQKREESGLGLTLAKKFVELHGGRIWVERHC